MKFAYFVKPHVGGTYTVFEQLREGLAPRGIDVRWLSIQRDGDRAPSPACAAIGGGPHWPGEEIAAARALLEMIEDQGFDGVFVNVLADRLEMNLARYMPSRLLRVMIVHSITPGTYAAAHALRDYVHATVGVSPRCRDDLVSRSGFPPALTMAIPNAVTLPASGRPPSARRGDGLRLLYLGRVDDASKGVLWLPNIMRQLPDLVRLTIVGDGPDLLKLKIRFAGDRRVSFPGSVGRDRIPPLLASHDVLIMPSRFEGMPLTLLEALSMGCVPVVSAIRGVTDAVVEHGADGLLFDVGDWRQASRHIETLLARPELLAAMSKRGREKARRRFGNDAMADRYAMLLHSLDARHAKLSDPLPLTEWSYPAGMRNSWRSALPQPVKNWLRRAKERL